MLQEERQKLILEHLSLLKKVRIPELTRQLGVSADTVRRDLIELEAAGKLLRVHGGAIAIDFHTPFQPAEVYARREKIEIAKKALTLIEEGMSFLAGGGTVMLEFARLLPETFKGTMFTVSPLVGLEAAQRSSVEVILLAGRLSRDSYISTGASVIRQLSEIKVDLCFMGANGFSLKRGITDYDWEVVQVKKAMMKASEQTALLAISEKIEVAQRLSVCPVQSVDYLITELPATHKRVRRYARYSTIL